MVITAQEYLPIRSVLLFLLAWWRQAVNPNQVESTIVLRITKWNFNENYKNRSPCLICPVDVQMAIRRQCGLSNQARHHLFLMSPKLLCYYTGLSSRGI